LLILSLLTINSYLKCLQSLFSVYFEEQIFCVCYGLGGSSSFTRRRSSMTFWENFSIVKAQSAEPTLIDTLEVWKSEFSLN